MKFGPLHNNAASYFVSNYLHDIVFLGKRKSEQWNESNDQTKSISLKSEQMLKRKLSKKLNL